MKSNVIVAAILGVCLIVASFVNGGRYFFVRLNDGHLVVGDKWTGKIRDVNYVTTKDFDF